MDETKEGLENEEDVYTPEGREAAMEDGSLTGEDEGFMQGYEQDENAVKCANCKKILEDDFIEEEVNEEQLRFCSDECAREYEKKQKET